MPSIASSFLRRSDTGPSASQPLASSAGHAWTPTNQVAAIIVLSIAATLLLATIFYTVFRMLRAYRSPAKVPKATETTDVPRKESAINWARKDSNVLWSMYISDDDLASQFRLPSRKESRLFSVGSVTTVDSNHKCPLDRSSMESVRLPDPPTRDHVASDSVGKGKEHFTHIPLSATDRHAGLPGDKESDVRSRATYAKETTPTKTLPSARAGQVRADSFARHRYTNSFESPLKQHFPLITARRQTESGHSGHLGKFRQNSIAV